MLELPYIKCFSVTFMTNNPTVKKEHFELTRAVYCGAAPLGALDEERFLQKAGGQVDILQGNH